MNNAQTFSQASDQYAASRPQYPAELFTRLSSLCSHHNTAWDCATGNGQAAIALADHFEQVEATDSSPEQIAHGLHHPKVRYSLAPAERTPFANDSFDLVTVAQAAHWFEQEQFHREVERVLKSKGVLAIWAYAQFETEPEILAHLHRELFEPIHPFWAAGNHLIMNGYRDLQLPFTEIQVPDSFHITVTWTASQLLAYLRTWSAVKRFATHHGFDPVTKLESTLTTLWGSPEKTRIVRMPLYVRACRKP